tara:strand:+ start:99 stop:329 length:231 start_codon:yes stop_codon:yes gene_type:complete
MVDDAMNAAGSGLEASGLSRCWKLAPPTRDESGDIKHGEKRGAKRATAQEWSPDSSRVGEASFQRRLSMHVVGRWI